MWATIHDDVLNGLREHVHTRRLIITGISLGGGLAAISYVDIRATNEFKDIEVITFGAPRVGNKKWAKWFDTLTESTRIYIRRDPIAFLPRCISPHCNYRQTGNPIVCYPKK
jgi:triacylglycerol lipase